MKTSNLDREQFGPVCNFVVDTYARVESEHSKNRALHSVMKKFSEASQKLMEVLQDGADGSGSDGGRVQELLMETEQAGESALKLAQHETRLPQDLCAQIQSAYDHVRNLKTNLLH
jgi:hypothetical protein